MGDHNSALLAKLGWKILNKENLLWVRATRGKYLRNVDLLDAPVQPSASWIWKGILSTLGIVSEGACKTISMSSMFNVWDTPWISSLPLFKPLPNMNTPINPSLCVADLIDPVTRTWMPDLIFQAFDVLSAENIMKIHVPRSAPSSDWFWAPNSQGTFTVNSAHDIAACVSNYTNGPLSSADWNCLWSLKLQHRLKHLLWRIA
ncbi:hypothetical protein SLA2020_286180 [Shorea laevis]